MTTEREIRTPTPSRTVVVDDETNDATVVDHRVGRAAESESVTTYADNWTLARGGMRMFNSLVGFALLIIETLLAFRLAFGLAGANRSNGFVQFIYDASYPFVAMFKGIASHQIDGRTVFEPETVIGMAVWAVVALLIVVAVNIMASAPAPSRTTASSRERHIHSDRSI